MSQQDKVAQEVHKIPAGNANPRRRYLPPEELSMFSEQVALILSSGVPLYDGIEALTSNYMGTSAYPSFERINQGVRDTGSLYESLKDIEIFPPYMVEMVKIGEQTGKLDQVMLSLSAYYLRESKIRRSVQNAVVYPLGLLLMMAVVITVLVVKVLPIFDQVYRSLGTEMPDSAITIMNFGTAVGNGVLIIAVALIGIVLVGVFLLRTGLRQRVIDFVCKIIPPIQRIYTCMSAAKFASNMSMMLASGYPLEQSIPLIGGVFEEPIAKAKIDACADKVAAGVPFPEAVADAGVFDKLHNKMIQMGYLSGRTDYVMDKLSYMYDEEVDNNIARLVAMIEPTMVALLSIIIGAILLSVMLPMVSIMSSII